MTQPLTVAVIFGGQSIEHDVSVLTGLQILEAIDSRRYQAFPVYIAPDGTWYVGDALRDRRNYLLSDRVRSGLDRVQLGLGAAREGAVRPRLESLEGGLLRRRRSYDFDIAVPSIHGTSGEDGALQGVFEFAGIPFVGCRTLAAAAFMDKQFAKRLVAAQGIPVLPCRLVERPRGSGFADVAALAAGIDLAYPLCVKPNNLGSSVAVARADGPEALAAALSTVFKFDCAALVEPFVPDLIEYNVAVTRAFGEPRSSAIERPLRQAELLAFKDKYLAGGDMDTKLSIPFSEGMASATREIDPPSLTPAQAESIRSWAVQAFLAVDGRGTARVDFLCHGGTGELWLNEVNTFPGSLAYFLWERADPPLGFTELMTALIEEGLAESRARRRLTDAGQAGANIFRRS